MKKLSKLLFASIGLVLCTSMLSTHSTSAQRSWHISGYPKAGSLRSTNAISGNGRYYTTHLFMCFDLRTTQGSKISPRSCGVGEGIIVRVESGAFRPTLRVFGPNGKLAGVGSDSNEIEFCPKTAGQYVIEVSSRHERAIGLYRLETIYMPSCKL